MGKRRTELAAVRKTSGYTQESLAAALGIDRSTVIRWEAGDYAPLPYLRPKLARLLRQSPGQLRVLLDGQGHGANGPIELNPDIEAACSWLDQETRTVPGTSRRRVLALLPETNTHDLQNDRSRRARIPRSDVVRALQTYYADPTEPYGLYEARYDDDALRTSVLTKPEWQGVACPLTLASRSMQLRNDVDDSSIDTAIDASQAVRRLAEAQALDVRLANEPLYRLLSADVAHGSVEGTVCLTEFVRYALTMDLLEYELLDALADDRPVRPGTLPLRDLYLPTLDAVTGLPARLCAGGVLALLAIARPAGIRGEPDYLFLVQERSSHVVNAARQLAVIPKGFHQPLTDYHADSQLAHSLLRELDEELFGRSEVDSTSQSARRSAQPMHPQRMSEPLQWLMQDRERLRLECTGFGINLVSGNYEFACLAVVEDEEFWTRYGGVIEANWEASGLRMYSTADRSSVRNLVADDSWTNEGLFALCEGLRRLD